MVVTHPPVELVKLRFTALTSMVGRLLWVWAVGVPVCPWCVCGLHNSLRPLGELGRSRVPETFAGGTEGSAVPAVCLAPEGTVGNSPARVRHQGCWGAECLCVTSRRWLETLSSLETLNQLCKHQVQSVTKLHSKRVSVLATHRSAQGPVLQAAPFSRWFHWEVGSCFTLSEGGSL